MTKLTKEDLKRYKGPVAVGEDTMAELTRLALLGLWAEEHGIPVVKRTDKSMQSGCIETGVDGSFSDEIDDALQALPKDKE